MYREEKTSVKVMITYINHCLQTYIEIPVRSIVILPQAQLELVRIIILFYKPVFDRNPECVYNKRVTKKTADGFKI